MYVLFSTVVINLNCLVLEQAGDHVEVATESEPVRFLLAAAKPLNEPVRNSMLTVANTLDCTLWTFCYVYKRRE